jgi:hypothetical protein
VNRDAERYLWHRSTGRADPLTRRIERVLSARRHARVTPRRWAVRRRLGLPGLRTAAFCAMLGFLLAFAAGWLQRDGAPRSPDRSASGEVPLSDAARVTSALPQAAGRYRGPRESRTAPGVARAMRPWIAPGRALLSSAPDLVVAGESAGAFFPAGGEPALPAVVCNHVPCGDAAVEDVSEDGAQEGAEGAAEASDRGGAEPIVERGTRRPRILR